MKKFELICPCHFGMEAVLKREIYDLGYDVTEVTDGKVILKEMKRRWRVRMFSFALPKECS